MGDAALTVSPGRHHLRHPHRRGTRPGRPVPALTMAPFALLAPFIGPLLDRFRHGRRWAIGTTLALRAFLCWVLAGAVANDSPWLFPAALGCLVASKAYGVTRASAVPRLLPPGFSLVNANSRNALAGVAGMAVGGGLAGAAARIGPEWSLRLAFLIYVVGTILAIRLPSRVDSCVGEHDIEDTGPLPPSAATHATLGPVQRLRARVAALPIDRCWPPCAARSAPGCSPASSRCSWPSSCESTRCPGTAAPSCSALVVGAAGAGNALGTVVGNALSRLRPDLIIAVALIPDVLAALATATVLLADHPLVLGPGGRPRRAADQAEQRRRRAARHRRAGPHPRLRLVRDGAADRLGRRWWDRHRPAAGPPARLRRDLGPAGAGPRGERPDQGVSRRRHRAVHRPDRAATRHPALDLRQDGRSSDAVRGCEASWCCPGCWA